MVTGVRRITAWVVGTVATLVLLFSYHTSHQGSFGPVQAGNAALGPAVAGTAPSVSGATGSTSAASGKTFTGDSADTQWGPVQVRITVSGGKVTAAQAVVYPDGNGRDQEINSYAIPVYNQEAVQKQSAQIDAISGATVTWGGYTASLQSALDQAGL